MSDDILSKLLLPYQQRWLADRSQVKITEKSRRIGLSWADALESVLTAGAKKENHGSDCYYIGYNREMAETYINDCATWARDLNLMIGDPQKKIIHDEKKDILVYRIRFASGHKIVALSSKPNNLRSRKGRVILDEFAFHDQPEELIKAAMALLVWGGRVAIISTHNGESNPFNEIIKRIRSGELDYSLHRTTFDDAVEQGLGKRIAAVTGVQWSQQWQDKWREDIFAFYGVMAQEELLCIPGNASGERVMQYFIESKHVAPAQFEYRWPLRISFDFNRNPATAVIGQVKQDEEGENHLFILDELFLHHSDTFRLGDAARKVIEKYRPYVTYITGDATGKRMSSSSLQSDWDIIRSKLAGLPLNWWVKESNPLVLETLNSCNSAFMNNRITVDPICRELIKDLNTVRLIQNPVTGKVEIDKKSNLERSHLIDGLRYMVESVMPYRGGGQFGENVSVVGKIPIDDTSFSGLPKDHGKEDWLLPELRRKSKSPFQTIQAGRRQLRFG